MDKILHIFCNTHHHNVSIIRYFSELKSCDVVHTFLIFDPAGETSFYENLMVDIHFFNRNMEIFPWLRKYHHEYDEVFFHGFFNHTLWELLQEDSLFCGKSSWLMFGADLLMDMYYGEDNPLFIKTTGIRRNCIPSMHSVFSNVSSSVDENICLTRYGKPGVFLKYAYYDNYDVTPQSLPDSLNDFLSEGHIVVIGNSADKSNQHIYLITQVYEKWPHAKILCPLTYSGDANYIATVIAYGRQCLGDRFYPLTDMLPKNAYFYVLSLCHVLLLGHQRQQAGHHWLFWLKHGKPLFGVRSAPIPCDLISKGAYIMDVGNIPDEKSLNEIASLFIKNKAVFDDNFSKTHIDILWKHNFGVLKNTR